MILLVHLLSLSVEKAFQILLVDMMNIAVVNCLIGCILAKALACFKLLLEILSLTMHPDFH